MSKKKEPQDLADYICEQLKKYEFFAIMKSGNKRPVPNQVRFPRVKQGGKYQ